MSLLSYNRLCELAGRGVVTNVKPEQINSSSIDLTLGNIILHEHAHFQEYTPMREVSLKDRDALRMEVHALSEKPFYLLPGQFILAHTEQMFNLPNNISGEYKLKSSMARVGLEHLNAGWCDAGWNGSVLTLELKNMTKNHIIKLEAGVGIGQMVFFEHEAVPEDRSYAVRGRYNGDKLVNGVKL